MKGSALFLTVSFSISFLAGCCKESSELKTEENNPEESAVITQQLPPLLTEKDVAKLPPEQKSLYESLNSNVQPIFLSLSPDERLDAVKYSKASPPNQAVRYAADHDAYGLPLEEQFLYFKLKPEVQPLFLILSDEATADAISLAKSMDPNEAVKEAAQNEVNLLPEEDRRLYQKLNPQGKILFLTLTPQVRATAVALATTVAPSIAVKNASWLDAKRLQTDQQEFFDDLHPDMQTLFLILTPNSRDMAIKLTKKMDPNLAVKYADRNLILQHYE